MNKDEYQASSPSRLCSRSQARNWELN